MEIPTEFVKRINPSIINPLAKSVVYTFQKPDAEENHVYPNYFFYRLPYSEDTFWTHFRYNTNPNTDLEFGIYIMTPENEYLVHEGLAMRNRSVWYEIYPIPSARTNNNNKGIYIVVDKDKSVQDISLKLLGFKGLYKYADKYFNEIFY